MSIPFALSSRVILAMAKVADSERRLIRADVFSTSCIISSKANEDAEKEEVKIRFSLEFYAGFIVCSDPSLLLELNSHKPR